MREADGSIDLFTDEDRWRWHAYDYAWRFFYLGDDRKFSSIDKDGDWFSMPLFDLAKTIFPLRSK